MRNTSSGDWIKRFQMVINRFVSHFRSNRLGRLLRGHISTWPGYQSMPGDEFFHNFKMRMRALASLISESLREQPESRRLRRSLRTYKDSETGQVLILGNGPSVRHLTLGQIQKFQESGGKIAVMNGFVESSLARSIRPDYYFVIDPDYWDENNSEGSHTKGLLTEYLKGPNSQCILVQPSNKPEISLTHENYLYIDGRSSQGLNKRALPDKPWGLPSSVAMTAISLMKYLGYSIIFFAGLDSDTYKSFFVDDLNRVMFSPTNNYFYSHVSPQAEKSRDVLSDARGMGNWPIRHMPDVLNAAAIFMRDLHILAADRCVNVGNDTTNDSAPRACLLK